MMKQLRLLFTMLMLTLLGGNAAWAASVDITPQQALNGGVTPITVACEKGDGTSNPAISSGQLRLYQAGSGKTTGNTITFSSDYTITSIEFTFANGMTADNGEFSEGDYNAETTTWNGSTNSVTLTVTGTKSGERIYITAMTVTYEDGGAVTQKVATPTFNPGEGSFTEAQDVEISTTTEDATIYYTTDGSTPTEESTEYTGAITIEETTTIKAIAVKDGMSDSDVATATYTIVSAGDGWVETSLDDLTGDDVFVIVGNNGNDYAMSNENGTNNPPSAVSVTIVDDKLIGTVPDNIKWNISGDAASGYTFYPNGSTETWLYCTNTNNGVRVGDNNNKTFKLQDDYLYHTATSRYVGIYSSQDWRCYGSINSNIQDQSFKFYKNPTAAPAVAKPTFSPAGGEYTEALSVTISCTKEGATIYYTTDGSTPTDESTEYTEAIAVSETTTIKAIAYVGTDASSVATAVYTITLPLTPITIAEARDQETGDVYTAGVVTSKNGSTVYIQDETAAIVVYGSNSLTIGDAITVQGTLTTFNGLLEIGDPVITVTSEDNEVTPEVMAIADISNDNQAKLIKIEGATVMAIDDKNVTIAQDENTIVVRFNNANDIKFEVEDVISLTGNIGCYNAPQIANPRDITVAGQMVSLPFYESFDTNDGKGGNDEEGWNGSIANNNIKYDNEGWEAKNVNGANQCAKAGSGSAGGSLTTPTLAFEAGKTYKLTFKAAAWNGTNEKTTLTLSASIGTLSDASVEMQKAAWTEYTVYLTGATVAGTIKFSTSAGNNRFFLDEVNIEECETPAVPVTIGTTGYATLYYSDKALEIPDGVSASIVTSAEGTIEFETLASVIPAGTGVVLEGAPGNYKFAIAEDAEAPSNNMLSGSDEVALTEGEGDCKFYQLSLAQGSTDASTIGFYWGVENGAAFRNGAHKAYLVVPAEQAKAMGYSFNGLVTDIRYIGAEAVNGEIYTIGGVRVKADKLQKGIYIVNGKKMVVK